MRILDFLVKERKRRTVVGFSFNIHAKSLLYQSISVPMNSLNPIPLFSSYKHAINVLPTNIAYDCDLKTRPLML